MSTEPTITFRVSLESDVRPDALYTVLADPNTHIVWAGEQAPKKGFRLLSMESPAGPLRVGSRFSSTGAANGNGSMTFHDESTVVLADPGRGFGFDTEARLERGRVKTWYCHFEHRYTIDARADGSTITYTCQVYPKNYRPYWLRWSMRPMTKVMVQRAHAAHMRNLVAMAEGATESGAARAG